MEHRFLRLVISNEFVKEFIRSHLKNGESSRIFIHQKLSPSISTYRRSIRNPLKTHQEPSFISSSIKASSGIHRKLI